MLKAVAARLKKFFPRGDDWTGTLGKVCLTGPARVEFSNHYVVDVRWMLRLGEFFVVRGAHVSTEWEHLDVVLRGFFKINWREVPNGKGGWRWKRTPRFTLSGHKTC